MNRHERRKKAAEQRKARRTGGDTMGRSFVQGLPPGAEEHPAFKAGVEAGKSGKLPPAYYDDIERLAKAACRWVHSQPTKPDLKWIRPKNDGVMIIAGLDTGAAYLADSPDAFRMLAALDEETERKMTLEQMTWALRLCRALPMPDGSYYGVTEKRSKGLDDFLSITNRILHGQNEADRIPKATCPGCGNGLDAATKPDGGGAEPGDIAVCIYCGDIHSFDDAFQLKSLAEDELAALPAELRDQLEGMQALIRGAAGSRLQGGRKGPVPEA